MLQRFYKDHVSCPLSSNIFYTTLLWHLGWEIVLSFIWLSCEGSQPELESLGSWKDLTWMESFIWRQMPVSANRTMLVSSSVTSLNLYRSTSTQKELHHLWSAQSISCSIPSLASPGTEGACLLFQGHSQTFAIRRFLNGSSGGLQMTRFLEMCNTHTQTHTHR